MKKGNRIYWEDSNGYWLKRKYNEKGNEIYFEDSNGYWAKTEYDEKGNEIYFIKIVMVKSLMKGDKNERIIN